MNSSHPTSEAGANGSEVNGVAVRNAFRFTTRRDQTLEVLRGYVHRVHEVVWRKVAWNNAFRLQSRNGVARRCLTDLAAAPQTAALKKQVIS